MSPLFETILVRNYRAPFLHYHEKRMNVTRRKLFNSKNYLQIPLPMPSDSKNYRLRVTYEDEIEKLELIPYERRYKERVLLVEATIDYKFKFCDRSFFDDLITKNPGFDDILVVKKGLLTDTTIANCCFFDGNRWYTPSTPLLKGTTRERLIKSKFLTPKKISLKDLESYSHVGFLNGLSGFYIAGETKRVLHVK